MRKIFLATWLKSPFFDSVFILLPSVFSVFLAYTISNSTTPENFPLWAWLVFVLGIDVAHVYSTLFRTYFNSNEFRENKALLTLIPIGVWLIGVILYSIDKMIFWRALAYVAVFHFIRQQYGFLRLYTRDEYPKSRDQILAKAVIYMATLYPLIFWHANPDRNFHWFVDGDFFLGIPSVISEITGVLYLVLLAAYFSNEIIRSLKGHPLNVPKNLIIIGTAISWYVGIVVLNGDLSFTITNVVSHGIPYMALVWIYGERQKERSDSPLILQRFSYKVFFSRYSVPLFIGSLLLFAYLEEGLWAGLIWREHLSAFGVFKSLPQLTAADTLSWLVPLLTLPQATHYVLDGFIWKMKDSGANWQRVLFNREFNK